MEKFKNQANKLNSLSRYRGQFEKKIEIAIFIAFLCLNSGYLQGFLPV